MTEERLRAVARVALGAGAIGSLVLLFMHGRPSAFLLILFTGWVLAPFIGLAWADRLSARWAGAPSSRRWLHYLMIGIAVGSLAVYGYDVATSYGGARLFVAVPMFAWGLALITIAIAVLAGRRSSRRTDV